MRLVDITEEQRVVVVIKVEGTPEEIERLRAGIKSLIEGTTAVPLLSVQDAGFSVRTSRVLANLGIDTVSQLLEKRPSELLKHRHFGVRSLREVTEWLATQGLALKPEREAQTTSTMEMIVADPASPEG